MVDFKDRDFRPLGFEGETCEFWNLLDAACEDTLSEEQAARLEELLRQDERAREVFEAYMQLNFVLYYQARIRAVHERSLEIRREPENRQEPESEVRKEPQNTLHVGPTTLGFLQRASTTLRPYGAVVIGAGLLMAVAVGGLMLWGAGSDQSPSNSPTAQNAMPDEPASNSKTVAHLIDGRYCSWARQTGDLRRGQRLFENQRLELLSGVAKIRFTSGAEIVVEGPGTLRLHSERRILLERGKLVGHVSPAAEGFTVDTPLGQVMDLGTRFAVACEDDLAAEFHVFEGQVLVRPKSTQPDEGPTAELRVSARQAYRLESGAHGSVAALLIAVTPRAFYHELPLEEGGLVAYYRFEGNLADSTGHGHDGVLVGKARISSDPERGDVLLCPSHGSGVDLDTVVPIPAFPANCSITLAAWVKRAKAADGNYEYTIQLGANGDQPIASLGLLPDGRIRGYLETDQSGLDQVAVTSKTSPESSGQFEKWRHIAIVYDRTDDKARIYWDGERDSTRSIKDTYDSAAFTWYGVSLGKATNSNSSLRGMIDDVRIYNRALSDDEIRRLVVEEANPERRGRT